ncbi:MAG: lysozyme, partial [Pseudomonadota bacterium]
MPHQPPTLNALRSRSLSSSATSTPTGPSKDDQYRSRSYPRPSPEAFRDTDTAALAILRWAEGFRSEAYWDAHGEVWTIGFGQTGDFVNAGDVWTLEDAESYLRRELRSYTVNAAGAIGEAWNGLNAWQKAALISFTYNLGAGALRRSTLARLIRNGKHEAAYGQFARWVYAGGERLPGLANRRALEAEFWRYGLDIDAQIEAKLDGAARLPRPDSPDRSIPASTTVWGSVVAGVTGVGSALQAWPTEFQWMAGIAIV